MVRVGGMAHTCDPVAAGWAAHQQHDAERQTRGSQQNPRWLLQPVMKAKGEPIWDVMEAYFKNHKTISPRKINTPKLVGMEGKPRHRALIVCLLRQGEKAPLALFLFVQWRNHPEPGTLPVIRVQPRASKGMADEICV